MCSSCLANGHKSFCEHLDGCTQFDSRRKSLVCRMHSFAPGFSRRDSAQSGSHERAVRSFRSGILSLAFVWAVSVFRRGMHYRGDLWQHSIHALLRGFPHGSSFPIRWHYAGRIGVVCAPAHLLEDQKRAKRSGPVRAFGSRPALRGRKNHRSLVAGPVSPGNPLCFQLRAG